MKKSTILLILTFLFIIDYFITNKEIYKISFIIIYVGYNIVKQLEENNNK